MPSQQIDYLLSTRAQPASDDDETTAPVTGWCDPWGGTDVWAYASGRLSDYSPEEWAQIAAGQQEWQRRVVELLEAGASADGEAARALAEEQRRWIERWYFTCPPQLHREVTDALLQDASVQLRYEALAPGAAGFIRAAVHANADHMLAS